MAQRTPAVPATTPETAETKRQCRRPEAEQIVHDLEQEIERVTARAAAHLAKADPRARALRGVANVLDRGAEGCSGDVRRALEAARAILGEQMVAMGIRAPRPRRRRQEAA